MKTPFDHSLNVLGLVALALLVATCEGDTGNPGPTGPRGPTGPMGSSGIAVTVVPYLGTTTDAAPTPNPAQLTTIGTFTKASGATNLQVVWNSHVTGAGFSCNFHVRVDGNASSVNDYGAVISPDAAPNAYYPVATTSIFTGLAAGTHTLTLWDRGVSATSCTDNPGNYQHYVIVTEF